MLVAVVNCPPRGSGAFRIHQIIHPTMYGHEDPRVDVMMLNKCLGGAFFLHTTMYVVIGTPTFELPYDFYVSVRWHALLRYFLVFYVCTCTWILDKLSHDTTLELPNTTS
jgi:hypothetical protein